MTLPPETERGSAVAGTENTLARAVMFFRVSGVVEVILGLSIGLASGRAGGVQASAAAAAIVIEAAVLCRACLRYGRLKPAWAWADLVFVVVLLVVDGMAEAGHRQWVGFTYAFSIIASVAFGVTLQRLRSVLIGTALLALGFFTQAAFRHSEQAPNLIIDMVTYAPNTLVAWMVARQMRSTGRELDAQRAQVAELAKEQERARHVRILHDHVLQTLESLVQQDAIPRRELAHAVAADAAWLRALVEGTPCNQGDDLLSNLQDLVLRHTRSGLKVEFNAVQLVRAGHARAHLSVAVSQAVTEAVGEALTNTAKHAQTDTAVLCATLTEDALTVSVLDHGAGFNVRATRWGVGLSQSLAGRIEEIGGTVRVDSSPDEGTYVEITVPVADAAPGAPRASQPGSSQPLGLLFSRAP